MSVLIKGVKMPTGCGLCRFEDYGYCTIAKQFTERTTPGVASFCPIVEVKVPHGDLIDKSKLIAVLHDTYLYEDMARKVIYRKVEEQPAVIEAEGMEE